jgi:hypothetical protein
VRQVVTKGGDDRVVVGTTPLAKDVWQAIDDDARAGLLGVSFDDLFGLALADAVRIIQFRLNRRGKDKRHSAPQFHQARANLRGKVYVAGRKFGFRLRTIHAGEVEDEIGLRKPRVQFRARVLHVEQEQGDVWLLGKPGNKIFADKAVGAGDEKVHGQRSKVRGQSVKWFHCSPGSEIRSQRSVVSGQKEGGGVVEHAAKHFADFGTERGQFSMLLGGDVTAISGKIERGVGLAVFAIAIGQPFDKLRTSLLMKCAS